MKRLPGLTSGFAMCAFPESALPMTPAGRLEFIFDLSCPRPILDDDGEPTGEFTTPILTPRDAARLLATL